MQMSMPLAFLIDQDRKYHKDVLCREEWTPDVRGGGEKLVWQKQNAKDYAQVFTFRVRLFRLLPNLFYTDTVIFSAF
jgi:hypothetical protein